MSNPTLIMHLGRIRDIQLALSRKSFLLSRAAHRKYSATRDRRISEFADEIEKQTRYLQSVLTDILLAASQEHPDE